MVIGPGSIGGAVAGALAVAGHDPLLAVRTSFDQLIVRGPDVSIDQPANCLTDPTAGQRADVVFLAVKAHQTAGARAWLDAFVGQGTMLVICQNGVEHIDRVTPMVAEGAVLVPAVVALPASRSAPGNISIGGKSRLTIPSGEAGSAVAELFAGSFLDIKLSEDWTTDAWIKLMLNAASGGICTLARTNNTVFQDAEVLDLATAVMREVAVVGRAEGARLAEDLPERIMAGMTERAGGHMSSIVVDRINGVPTEWDARNAVVLRLAERHGIDAPLNRVLTTLIRVGEPDGHDGSMT